MMVTDACTGHRVFLVTALQEVEVEGNYGWVPAFV